MLIVLNMFNLLWICLIILNGVVDVFSYSIPNPKIEILSPKGLRISIPHENNIVLVGYHIKINKPIALNEPGDFSTDISKPTNGRWTYDNTRVFVDPGNVINYWIHVQYGRVSYRKLGSEIASGNLVYSSPSEKPSLSKPTVNVLNDCEKSATTVRQTPVCKGQLIFEDNFDTLNWTIWKREVRMTLDADDAEFVSYQSRPENCYINSGQLHIVPSLLIDLPGFNNTRVRNGKLDLGAECTAIVDVSNECTREARFSKILPPVVSARINTRNFFHFRFGRVEVRAKLPKGDWLYPLILLEPFERYYGFTGYASGEIRVAFNRGNEFLKTRDCENISGNRIFGGVVLSTDEKLRHTWLKGFNQPSHLANDFHIYTLIWTGDHISFAIDGNEYATIRGGFSQLHDTENIHHAGRWNNGHIMAPFDREFYLTLGVSVGGHSDFPNESLNGEAQVRKPWRNRDHKAQSRFWDDRENWLKTWKNDEIGLHVDYIKVYAL